MSTQKKFLIYVIVIILFFIFSKIMIAIALIGTYKNKDVEINSKVPIQAQMQVTAINGLVVGNIINNTENVIENKFVRIECYSKHNVLMGTKYVEIDKIEVNGKKEFATRFNFNKVEKAVIDLVDDKYIEEENIPQEQRQSDPERGLAALVAAIIFISII